MGKKKDEDVWVLTDLIGSLRKSVDFSYELERKTMARTSRGMGRS
jgi:hypothetical protein